MVDPFSGSDFRKDLIFLWMQFRWDERQYRPAENLVRGVSKDPRRGIVPRKDCPVKIFANDCVIGRLDDGSKMGPGIKSNLWGWKVSTLGGFGRFLSQNLVSAGVLEGVDWQVYPRCWLGPQPSALESRPPNKGNPS